MSCPMYHTKGFACLKKSSPLTSQLVPPDQRWCVSDLPQGNLPWGGPPGPWGSAQHAVPASLRLCPWSRKTHPPEEQEQEDWERAMVRHRNLDPTFKGSNPFF